MTVVNDDDNIIAKVFTIVNVCEAKETRMDNKFAPLFKPWKIGNCEIKNRIIMEPMTGTGIINSQVGFKVNKKVFDFFRERSKNEVGLFIPGGDYTYILSR